MAIDHQGYDQGLGPQGQARPGTLKAKAKAKAWTLKAKAKTKTKAMNQGRKNNQIFCLLRKSVIFTYLSFALFCLFSPLLRKSINVDLTPFFIFLIFFPSPQKFTQIHNVFSTFSLILIFFLYSHEICTLTKPVR